VADRAVSRSSGEPAVTEKLGAPRQQEILARDFASPAQTFVKVRVRINSVVFVDYLTLIKLSTGWKIVSKTYQVVERV
jgi:Putative lumazine-binding